MKTIILAGGLGTRLSEETTIKPKPLVEVGDRPILWHIMSIYAAHGFQEFIVALGYKGELIREYFLHFHERMHDLTVNLSTGERRIHAGVKPDWTIHLVDTGAETQTGGRIRRLANWIGNERFMATYGDGVGDIDIKALLAFHRGHGRLATVTVVRSPSRFGEMTIEGEQVTRFEEKPQADAKWINGGFFIFEPEVLQYFRDDLEPLERGPLERLTAVNQLMAYKHEGFWQPMDTLREKRRLDELWASGKAPWKVWK